MITKYWICDIREIHIPEKFVCIWYKTGTTSMDCDIHVTCVYVYVYMYIATYISILSTYVCTSQGIPDVHLL